MAKSQCLLSAIDLMKCIIWGLRSCRLQVLEESAHLLEAFKRSGSSLAPVNVKRRKLPAFQVRSQILDKLDRHQTLVISGSTGVRILPCSAYQREKAAPLLSCWDRKMQFRTLLQRHIFPLGVHQDLSPSLVWTDASNVLRISAIKHHYGRAIQAVLERYLRLHGRVSTHQRIYIF